MGGLAAEGFLGRAAARARKGCSARAARRAGREARGPPAGSGERARERAEARETAKDGERREAGNADARRRGQGEERGEAARADGKKAARRAAGWRKGEDAQVSVCHGYRSGQSAVQSRPVPRVVRGCRHFRRPLWTCASWSWLSQRRRRASRPPPWIRCGTLSANGGLCDSSFAFSLVSPGPRSGSAPTSVGPAPVRP